MIGQIRNLNPDRDFAFIVCGANRDIFLHRREYKGSWPELLELHKKGVITVEFDVIEGEKGLVAIKCRVKINVKNNS